jgi:uroporphyrin-III C-methyltransferase/precorrin-2 dehydrogenase/sirohydrochlorin ferrochelatase
LRPWAAHNLTSGYQRREFWTIFLKTMRKQQNSDFTEAKKLAHSIAQDMVDPIKSKNSKGSVDFITTGPGDPELLTLKSRKAINKADTVIYDKSVSQEIIELARREALMLSSEQASEILVHHALNGQHIVRLSASGEFPKQEISSLTQHSIPFMLLPGVEIKQRHKIPTHLFSIPHKTVHLQSSSKAA